EDGIRAFHVTGVQTCALPILPRQTGFDITAASEVMAVLALARSLPDLRARLGRIVVAYDRAGNPVTAEDLHAAGAMCVQLRDAQIGRASSRGGGHLASDARDV